MSEDLQSLLEKINREGVEKAQKEAAAIVEKAKADAAKLVAEAKAEAARAKEDAERSARESAARSAETIRQAARDTVLQVEDAVTKLLENLLAKSVDAALADPAKVSKIAADVVGEFVSKGDVTVSAAAELAASLKASLAAKREVQVVTDETIGKGFSVKLDGGRVEHAFTGAVVADELARRLRPELAALVRG